MLKKVLALFLLIFFGCQTIAADLVDDSIDNDIRTKYNTKKIEDDLLPDLPKELPSFDENIFSPSAVPSPVKPQTAPQTQIQSKPQNYSQTIPKPVNTSKNSNYRNNSKSSIILNSGKKFKVKLSGSVSDKTPAGTRISFVSKYPETFRYITIPAGTVFKGKVEDSHPPYLAGNGGLIVIGVYEMVFGGKAYEIDAKISMADHKHIFLNNIKGKRKYMKNTWNSTSFGSKFLKKMWKTTCRSLNKGGLDILVAPFSLAGGVIVYGANVISSPFLALFTKGGPISIPSGSDFVIQLTKDAVITK